jgi:hypothetical protein
MELELPCKGRGPGGENREGTGWQRIVFFFMFFFGVGCCAKEVTGNLL